MLIPDSDPTRKKPPSLPLSSGTAKIGFLNIYCGGTGRMAMPHVTRNTDRDGNVFPCVNVLVDTDPVSFDDVEFDVPIYLKVTPDIVDMIRGNYSLFDENVGKILANEARMLADGDITNGMRTTRCLSQIVWSYHKDYIADQLRDACDLLMKSGVTSILPMIASSTGGGTGSAVSVLMMIALSASGFASAMLLGYSPKLLLPPIVFAVDPLAYARQKKGMQRKKILANSYAYRLETDELIRRGVKCQYIFHIGFANEYGATVRTGTEMGQVLGNSIYAIERNYPNLKRDWVDGPDDAAATDHARVTNSLTRMMLAGANGSISRKEPQQ